jgi:short-chain Z-isoprenyl diphosphate synthase
VTLRDDLRRVAYSLYEWRLRRRGATSAPPRHIGVILDGNRRWAREAGLADPSDGHRVGAAKIVDLLDWSQEAGVEVVTLFLLSTDNLDRPTAELDQLLEIIASAVEGLAAPDRRWRLRVVGNPDALPRPLAERIEAAADGTAGRDGMEVNVAIGYGGRQEIADAVRSLLAEHAERGTTLEELVEALEVEHIAEHLYTRGQPDPDLVIRTSGEQRLSGFLLWQTANTEFHFTDVYWPDFRRVDFLRALRDYSARHRRFGS